MFNQNRTTPAIRGLVNSGADLLKHMYDIKVYFPDTSNGQPSSSPFNSYPITVRAQGFNIPEVAVKTYPISYHGITINRPAAALEGERTFDITFREDAAFELRRRFSAWLAQVVDPVTGGVSNATAFFGKIEVGTLAGAYYATSMVKPNGSGYSDEGSILDSHGAISATNSSSNPVAGWVFYNVWVSKVGGVEFSTESTDANTFTVTFQYMDCDMPTFGGNALDLGWTAHSTYADSNNQRS